MAYNYEDVLNAKKVADNGLLSKIQIGGKVYELKDLIAREGIVDLKGLVDALAAKVGTVPENVNIYEMIQQIQKEAYDDTALRAEIADEFAKEAKAREDSDAAIGERIDAIDAVLNVIDDADGINTLKELAQWVVDHETEVLPLISANTKAIEDEAKARAEADAAINKRLDDMFGEGEGSVADQVADALDEAKSHAQGLVDGLGALAKKDSASGVVAGQTISGVKASGTSAGSITVELEQSSHAMNSTGKYTPAGNVSGTVETAGSIAVTAKYDAADAVLSKGDYTPAGTVTSDFGHATAAAELIMSKHAPEGSVSVALSGNSFNAITGVGTQASFVEGEFTPASLSYAAADYSVAKEGIVGSVDENECLIFTAAGLEAISASKINSFNGGSKEADQFTANSLPTMAAQTVGVASATFTGVEHDCVSGVNYEKATMSALTFAGAKAEGALVTGVSYQKADIGSATFTGATVDIAATFAGTEGDIAVAGTCHDYAVKTAQFNPAAIEVAVGDIVVAEKNVTVQ